MEDSMAGTCPSCGSPLSHHDRHIRFRLPDPVIEVPEEERAERFWGNDVMLAVKDLGSFVRALLPVHLDDGGSLTFGLWLGVHPDTLRHLWEVWWKPEYAEVSFTGYIANDLVPWSGSVLAMPVTAEPRDPDTAPYVTGSEDPTVHRIVTEKWDPQLILPPYANLL
jgi:hypothetical protein